MCRITCHENLCYKYLRKCHIIFKSALFSLFRNSTIDCLLTVFHITSEENQFRLLNKVIQHHKEAVKILPSPLEW